MEYDPALTGAELILAERERQLKVEGYSASEDDKLRYEQLAHGALAYLDFYLGSSQDVAINGWPWDESTFKPDRMNEVRNLVKAGAMIAAEIDRRQRLETKAV